MILLDTDVLVDIQRALPQAVSWFGSVPADDIAIPGYAAMELVQGCQSRRDLENVEEFLRGLRIVWPDQAACDAALDILARSKLSHGLGLIDALIAQLAVSMGIPLCTFNQRHFAGVPHLVTQRPYSR